jgi:hypothetical protein
MIDDDRHLAAIDSGLARIFGDDELVPPDFTLHVLRRIHDQRWKREAFLRRVCYAGICASGSLIIAGISVAFSTLVPLSSEAAVKFAVAGLAISALATWPTLRRAV